MFGYATNPDSSAPRRKTETPGPKTQPASFHDIFGIVLGIVSIVIMVIRILRAF